jgi:hypothetical protein
MIPCAVTVLVLYFHLFFISLVDWIRIAPLSLKLRPCNVPYIYLMTTHILFIASSSLLLPPAFALSPGSLTLAESVTPPSMVDKVAISPPTLAR